jgi:hypothetical protein
MSTAPDPALVPVVLEVLSKLRLVKRDPAVLESIDAALAELGGR